MHLRSLRIYMTHCVKVRELIMNFTYEIVTAYLW
jgi:hypothetical protein